MDVLYIFLCIAGAITLPLIFVAGLASVTVLLVGLEDDYLIFDGLPPPPPYEDKEGDYGYYDDSDSSVMLK